MFGTDIVTRWNREGAECPFASCELEKPSYQMMSEAESDYYFYWRSMLRKGKYLKTCRGYLYLFTCEIINTDTDAETNLRNLVNAVRVYRSTDQYLLDSMADACFTYARIHKLPEPDIDRASDVSVIGGMLTSALSEKPVGRVHMGIVRGIMSESDLKFMDGDHPYGDLLTECLRRIDRWETKEHGKRIIDRIGRIRRTQYDVYQGFRYFGDRQRVTVSSADFGFDSAGRNFVRGTVRYLLREVRAREGLSVPMVSAYPLQYRTVITETVEDWKHGYWEPDDVDGSGFTLDVRSVRSAKADLDAVAEMMSSEEEEDACETAAEEVSSGGCDDLWEGFATSLDEPGVEYLRAAMEGDTRATLKRLGLRMSAIEERVNDLAMEIVGDTVVEGGDIIEDYRDELERIL